MGPKKPESIHRTATWKLEIMNIMKQWEVTIQKWLSKPQNLNALVSFFMDVSMYNGRIFWDPEERRDEPHSASVGEKVGLSIGGVVAAIVVGLGMCATFSNISKRPALPLNIQYTAIGLSELIICLAFLFQHSGRWENTKKGETDY